MFLSILILVILPLNLPPNHNSFLFLKSNVDLLQSRTVFAFHSEVTHTSAALMQELIKITSMELNNTERAIQDNNITQAITYLHAAQQQLNKLNNNTLLLNVSTMLLQSGMAYNLNPSFQSAQPMSSLELPPLSSSSQSVPDPQIPQSLAGIEELDDSYKSNPILPNLNSKIITPSSSLPTPPTKNPSADFSSSQLQSNKLPSGLPPISSSPSTGNSPPSSISSEIEPLSPTSETLESSTVPGLPPISSSR